MGKSPSKFRGSKSWWGKFPHFPQWWILFRRQNGADNGGNVNDADADADDE